MIHWFNRKEVENTNSYTYYVHKDDYEEANYRLRTEHAWD